MMPAITTPIQARFPNSDMCSDLEYSLFLMNLESTYWVASNITTTAGKRKIASSALARKTKTTIAERITADTFEKSNEW
jgi:hypothetical protein